MSDEREVMERLRKLLRDQVEPPLQVSDKRTHYAFDEDSEAFCDIDVRDPTAAGDGFVMVVVSQPSTAMAGFMARAWHWHVPEVWTLGSREITRWLNDGSNVALGETHTVTSPLLPGVAIPIRALWS